MSLSLLISLLNHLQIVYFYKLVVLLFVMIKLRVAQNGFSKCQTIFFINSPLNMSTYRIVLFSLDNIIIKTVLNHNEMKKEKKMVRNITIKSLME